MSIRIEPIDPINRPYFGGKALGIDLLQPVTDEEVAAIFAGMDRFGVMVFPGQDIDDAALQAFSLKFGPLEKPVADVLRDDQQRQGNQVGRITNLDDNGRCFTKDNPERMQRLASRFWHTDSSFRPIPAKYSFLLAYTIPSIGGETEFADMRAAYDALPDEMKATVEDLVCEHDLRFCREALGIHTAFAAEGDETTRVQQRLVWRHPGSKRKVLYFGIHTGSIVGWSEPDSRVFLHDLTEHAAQREFVYRHEWQRHDLVIWDNRAVLHRQRAFDESQPRDLHRATVACDVSTFDQPR